MKKRKISFEDYCDEVLQVTLLSIEKETGKDYTDFFRKMSKKNFDFLNYVLNTTYSCPYYPIQPTEKREVH